MSIREAAGWVDMTRVYGCVMVSVDEGHSTVVTEGDMVGVSFRLRRQRVRLAMIGSPDVSQYRPWSPPALLDARDIDVSRHARA